MSVQTLYTAATGMEALETKLDVIANNIANINTVGFKKDRANFEDLFYRHEVLPGANQSNPTAVGTSVGLGTRVSSVQSNFRQGAFQQTGNRFDLGIEGNGFFRVADPTSGATYYTRAGNFDVNANGQLVMGSAQSSKVIDPPVQIPNTAIDVEISPNGQVLYRTVGSTQLQQAGQLQLATFINPDGLLKTGDNLYLETDASGSATTADPGTSGLGLMRQGWLEASNVEPVHELIDLITTQRSFELNSQAVQAGDQVLQLISNLRRF